MKRISTTSLFAACAVFLGGGMASAQVTPIPLFEGEFNEPFGPNGTPMGVFCIDERVFGGTADLCSTGVSWEAMWVSIGWSGNCPLTPYAGTHFAAAADGAVAEYTFDQTIRRFGGFFTTNFNNVATGGVTATFYDDENIQIAQVPFTVTCGQWEWKGWESTVGVKRIVIAANNGNSFVMMDEMTYDPFDQTPPCYANCDGSTSEPILTIDDFLCFINEFSAAQALPPAQQQSHYANCTGSTAEPYLTIDDFLCFINEFAAGCP